MGSSNRRAAAPLVFGLLLAPSLALGAPPHPAAAVDARSVIEAVSECGCAAQRPEVEALGVRIAVAGDVDEARSLALEDARRARSALRRAQWLAPGSDSIRAAGDRLDAYETRVMAAATPEEVSQQFASLMHNNDIDVDVDLDDGCHYSTGEIIVIVLGLLLGIIPGLILMVLLC